MHRVLRPLLPVCFYHLSYHCHVEAKTDARASHSFLCHRKTLVFLRLASKHLPCRCRALHHGDASLNHAACHLVDLKNLRPTHRGSNDLQLTYRDQNLEKLAILSVGIPAEPFLLLHLFLQTQHCLHHLCALVPFVFRSRVRVLNYCDHEVVSCYRDDLLNRSSNQSLRQSSHCHDPSLAFVLSSFVSAQLLLRDPSPFEPSQLKHPLQPTFPHRAISKALWHTPSLMLECLHGPFHLLPIDLEYVTACFLALDELGRHRTDEQAPRDLLLCAYILMIGDKQADYRRGTRAIYCKEQQIPCASSPLTPHHPPTPWNTVCSKRLLRTTFHRISTCLQLSTSPTKRWLSSQPRPLYSQKANLRWLELTHQNSRRC
mmetsp:Transcript_25420/g.62541  ORF Transcript_25420/g.62541 Transcript_25420/m.62541 type:complete len:373 (-) Transcript_25420:2328-3446(-)